MRSLITALLIVLVLAIIEVGFLNSFRVGQYFFHPVLLYVILSRHGQSAASRLAVGITGGFLLDCFLPTPFGLWLIGLSVGVIGTDLIFTNWLSHRSWIAPLALTTMGWFTVRIVGAALNPNPHVLGEWFNHSGLLFWGQDFLWTIGSAIAVTLVAQFLVRSFPSLSIRRSREYAAS